MLCATALPYFAQSNPPAQANQEKCPPGGAAAPDGWREFAPLVGGFSILLPGRPRPGVRPLVVNDRPFDVFVFDVNSAAEYSVTFVDLPVRPGDAAAARSVLDALAANEAGGAQGASVSEVSLGGHPGRLLRWRTADGRDARAKMLLVDQRLYRAAVVAPAGQDAAAARSQEAAADKFLDSFKLAPCLLLGPGEVTRYLARHAGEFELTADGGEEASADDGRFVAGKVLSRPEPEYPPVARAARASGAVVVVIVADESGKIAAAQVVSGHPLLHEAALEAARKLRFRPPTYDGKPRKFTGTMSYNFKPR